MEWKTVQYSRAQINRAGRKIINSEDENISLDEAMEIIDNWRASHAYPLHVFYTYFRRNYIDKDYIVAERLKRLNSIVDKLKREPHMQLWKMQDLGGCRIITPQIEDVYTVKDKYQVSSVRHILKREYDYIKYPKMSGYRGIHLVYEYKSDKKDTYNRNMLIEIQVRSYLQHLWATAVETIGLFTKQALKAGKGEEDILYFFKLISSAFAIVEKQPLVPETPTTMEGIVKEIMTLDKQSNILAFLSGIRVAADRIEGKYKSQNGYYILILNYETRMLRTQYYKPSDIEKANEIYNQIEQSRDASKIDAVLVSVSSVSQLKAAYPNYFLNIAEFTERVQQILINFEFI